MHYTSGRARHVALLRMMMRGKTGADDKDSTLFPFFVLEQVVVVVFASSKEPSQNRERGRGGGKAAAFLLLFPLNKSIPVFELCLFRTITRWKKKDFHMYVTRTTYEK